ncbi:MAG: hypothetical protein IJR88_01610 [Clostridia bacterium]|nr:hypothetical protein [Clostridia bacterium]
MENRTKTQKAISFSLLLFAGLFLFTPIFAMLDPLPDAIGLLLFVIALSGLCDLSDEISNARKLFLYLFLLSLLREALTLILYTVGKAENAFEVPTLFLLESFVWAILQGVLLIPAFRRLFRGLSDLAERYGGEALWKVKRGKTLCERASGKTTVLILLHSLFITLPEFSALGLRQGESVDGGLYGYINLYRVFAVFVLIILWILWMILWIRFCRVLNREKEFSDRLSKARIQDEIDHPGRAERRFVYGGLLFCALFALVFLPMRVGDYSIFPGALCGIFAWIGFARLRRPKCWPLCLSLILVSLGRMVLHFLYLIDHLPKDALYETQAYYFYLAVRMTQIVELLLAILVLIFLYRTIVSLVKNRVLIRYEKGEDAEEASQHATKKLQKSLLAKIRTGWIVFLVAALLSIADILLRPGFAYLWIPAAFLAAAGLFVFWIPAFKEATDDFVTLKDESV